MYPNEPSFPIETFVLQPTNIVPISVRNHAIDSDSIDFICHYCGYTLMKYNDVMVIHNNAMNTSSPSVGGHELGMCSRLAKQNNVQADRGMAMYTCMLDEATTTI